MKHFIILIMLLVITNSARANTFENSINKEESKISEQNIIIQEWINLLGFNIWLPYIKLKHIEKAIGDKLSCKLGEFEGTLSIENHENLQYKFSYKF